MREFQHAVEMLLGTDRRIFLRPLSRLFVIDEEAVDRAGFKLFIEFERPMTPAQVREILAKAPGVRIVDNVDANHFPMPLEASGQDEVLVGRIRQDISRDDGRGIDLFVSGDQIRTGAATNAVQIAEKLV